MIEITKKIAQSLVDLVFPRTDGCVMLASYIPADFYHKTPKISLVNNSVPSAVRGPDIHTCFPYRHPIVKTLIWEIKDGKNTHAATLAGYAISRILERVVAENTGMISERIDLIPIPTTYMKRCERGYNQCDLIVDAVVRTNPGKFIVLKNTLKYKHWLTRREQKSRRKKDRLEKSHGQFVIDGVLPTGTTIVIVDDVTTTGATLRAAIDAIRASGVERVIGIAVAH